MQIEGLVTLAVTVGLGLTVTVIVVTFPHCPVLGVKVYVVVPGAEVFMLEGFQVPIMPFVDVVGNVPGVAPWQYGPKALNVGVMLGFKVTVTVLVFEHPAEV